MNDKTSNLTAVELIGNNSTMLAAVESAFANVALSTRAEAEKTNTRSKATKLQKDGGLVVVVVVVVVVVDVVAVGDGDGEATMELVCCEYETDADSDGVTLGLALEYTLLVVAVVVGACVVACTQTYGFKSSAPNTALDSIDNRRPEYTFCAPPPMTRSSASFDTRMSGTPIATIVTLLDRRASAAACTSLSVSAEPSVNTKITTSPPRAPLPAVSTWFCMYVSPRLLPDVAPAGREMLSKADSMALTLVNSPKANSSRGLPMFSTAATLHTIYDMMYKSIEFATNSTALWPMDRYDTSRAASWSSEANWASESSTEPSSRNTTSTASKVQ